MFVNDQATPLSRRRTPEGALQLRARIARVGVHDYKAGEIGAAGAPDAPVRVYRSPEEVFAPASMASFAGVPVTLDHPPAMVDAANRARFAIGEAGPAPVRDGRHLVADLTLTDPVAIDRAEAGAELSNGYWADFVFEPGTTPEGEAYDARQRNIRGNHIAIVDQGRCGPTCRIDPGVDVARTGDCACAGATGDAAGPRRVVLDGVAIETTPEGAAAIARLEAALLEARRARAPSVPDAAALDALVAERALALEGARALLGPGFEGRGRATAAIRRAAVGKILGAPRVEGRDDAYVMAAFDALVAARGPGNPLAAQLASAAPAASREQALGARDRFLTQAWKADPPATGAP